MSGKGKSAGIGSGGNPSGRSRGNRVRVKTARGRKTSSTRWLERQLNDPYVAEAKRLGYRSRAAFKLLELDEKFSLFAGRRNIVDLGAAPGGWSQVAVARASKGARVIGCDLLEVEPIQGADIMVMDFLADDAEERLFAALEGERADIVLSDMANSATGHRQTDHLRTMALCDAAYDFARKTLSVGGIFVAKVLRGGTEQELLNRLKLDFESVRHVKPQASRKESSELYVLATGFRGIADTDSPSEH